MLLFHRQLRVHGKKKNKNVQPLGSDSQLTANMDAAIHRWFVVVFFRFAESLFAFLTFTPTERSFA